jgi:hypothetical protein
MQLSCSSQMLVTEKSICFHVHVCVNRMYVLCVLQIGLYLLTESVACMTYLEQCCQMSSVELQYLSDLLLHVFFISYQVWDIFMNIFYKFIYFCYCSI